MKTTTGAIVEKLKNNNMQKTMQDDIVRYDYNGDYSLAKSIDDFLNAKSNSLINYELLEKIIKNANSSLISVGMGITVDDDLKITIVEPINETENRVDVIKTNDYYAFFEKKDSKFDLIDLEKDKRYDRKRIDFLRSYIKNYSDYLANKQKKTK